MARALRMERPGERYHVTARANERKDLFRDDIDHFHFLELLSEMGQRFAVRVHACVLMDGGDQQSDRALWPVPGAGRFLIRALSRTETRLPK